MTLESHEFVRGSTSRRGNSSIRFIEKRCFRVTNVLHTNLGKYVLFKRVLCFMTKVLQKVIGCYKKRAARIRDSQFFLTTFTKYGSREGNPSEVPFPKFLSTSTYFINLPESILLYASYYKKRRRHIQPTSFLFNL